MNVVSIGARIGDRTLRSLNYNYSSNTGRINRIQVPAPLIDVTLLTYFISYFLLVCFSDVSSFGVPNFVRFDAGMLKLQQMIKWDVFLEHGVDFSEDLNR